MTDMMRALVFEGPNRMNLRQIPRPRPGPGEVLIRVHATAICGTDIRIFTGRKTREIRHGHPIGHECAGTVAAVGAGVTGYTSGEPVAVCVVVSCGQCEYCRADRENLCDTRYTLGYATDGSFAEYMLIPALAVSRGNLFHLPPQIPMEMAPLLEPIACCLNGQHEMGLGQDKGVKDGRPQSLLIFGAGPIGLIHLMLAKAKGVRPITVVEPVAHRRELAGRFGADEVVSPDQFVVAARFDAAILAVGVPELVNVALRAVKKTGRISLFAGFSGGATATIDPNAVHYGQITISGASESRRRDFAEAMSLVQRGIIDPALLLTHRFSLDQYEQAFRVAGDGTAVKVIFEI
ncbi:MAG TPA: alcohol dehydrogenase catalytic domain-containing protein [Phycisphaerae bacterium]|mgnify:CR=1 FL=1|nr:alcohol dehydrogenase catalytic domain-containing protein [Phycisphaerae bacterium]